MGGSCKIHRIIIMSIVSLIVVFVLLQQIEARASQPRYYLTVGEDGVEREVELIPSAVTVKPRPRQRIRSEIAKQYWTSGNFFTRDNFKVVPTLTSRSGEGEATLTEPFIVMPMTAASGDASTFQDL